MIQFPKELKPTVVAALLEQRNNFDGGDKQFAKRYGITLKDYRNITTWRTYDTLMSPAKWIKAARELGIDRKQQPWKTARTEVFEAIEEDVIFCQENSKSLILADDCGIGKTYTAKYLSRTRKNCFYIDASQCPTKIEFIRAIAKAIGVDSNNSLNDIRADVKYALAMLPNPCVIVDEAGELKNDAAMLIKELWNATEKCCGWYLMGADGLRAKMERNIRTKKVGWAELFSRHNDRYNKIVPVDKDERLAFYKKLITDVLSANLNDKSQLTAIVHKCLTNDSGQISGLRRAETLILLHAA
jgi:hypothetical protein